MANRILGMGDVLTLIEKAQDTVSEEQMKKMEKRMRENTFTLTDYLEQFETVKKMGGVGSLLSMMPTNINLGKNVKLSDAEIDEKRIERMKAIIQSMTVKERENPSILNYSRKMRIVKGSGTTIQEVNQLLKQFEQTKLMMKQMKNGKLKKFPF